MSEKTTKAKGAKPLAQYLWLAALAALAAFAAVYVMVGRPDNEGGSGAPPQAAHETKEGAHGNPLLTGAMTTFVVKKPPAALPDVHFLNDKGEDESLKGFAGKVVLLNLWATWCAPCREEMPALAKLEKELGSDKFQVVALAVDKAGLDGARKFFQDNKIDGLAPYADPTARVGTKLKVIGMPTTILLNGEGREIGRLIGPAAWDSAEAKRLIKSFL
jgi:thiol-disulfide isomerase/thioredoxin